jgi:DNA-directed RNA polymerase subunit F
MHYLTRLGQSLEESMANEKLTELVADLGDVTLDQLAETGESLPIISFISKSIKTYNSIRDHFFMEKVIRYLTEIATISPELRQKAIKQITDDTKYGIKFGKKILNIIDRLDDDIKAYYLAKAYRYFAEGQITLEFYLRLGTMLDSMYLANIETLQNDWISLDGHPTNSVFETLGLAKQSIHIFDVKNPTKSINAEKYKVVYQPGYRFTDTGRVVNNIFLGKPVYYKSKYTTVEDFNKHVGY